MQSHLDEPHGLRFLPNNLSLETRAGFVFGCFGPCVVAENAQAMHDLVLHFMREDETLEEISMQYYGNKTDSILIVQFNPVIRPLRNVFIPFAD